MPDMVNHPPHYQAVNDSTGAYETIKVLRAWLTREEYVGMLKGNTIKYLSRLGRKGNAVEDAGKARWYLNELIKTLEEQP